MATEIHPQACVEKGAQLDEGVSIGPFAYVGAGVSLGKGTVLHHHASVEGMTVMGRDNEVFPYACIGGKTQDLKFKGGDLGLQVGDRNVFRESVTVHMSTIEGTRTEIGDDNNLLAYSHVAHDATVGSHLIMSSNAAIGGHCIVDDHVYIAWASGLSPFVRVGKFSIVGAMSKITKNVPPFLMVDGNPGRVRTINKVRLERMGYDASAIEAAKSIYRTIYREGLNRSQAVEKLKENPESDAELYQLMIQFHGDSKMGYL
ncbi:MAG: acyl-ACP--UDP-N-acetylglucosamine O-acyltransferase [Opitutales bacterium]|nr:acyl-ACP--UDP-N-acetylglucosamine O-acyltransferase [Opitutales bacterium]NRA25894.1 acyl-ACP--UDP-N-acetylglucosamine O-acyltransferase [Opitutales bacterium]